MRVAPCLFVLASLIGGLGGCASFGKRSSDPARPTGGAAGAVSPVRFPGGDPILNSNTTAAANPSQSAILAGRVLDGSSRPPANTSIRLVSLEDKEKEKNSTDVAVTPEGFFTIQGLKPGAQYKLVARGKAGEHLVAGITYTTAPNIRVVIQVKEDFANGATPDVPPTPGYPGKTKTSALDPWDTRGNASAGLGTPRPMTDLDVPAMIVPAPPPTATPASSANPGWIPGLAQDGGTFPPTLNIPPRRDTPPPSPPPIQIPRNLAPAPTLPDPAKPPVSISRPTPTPQAKIPNAGPTLVPSCVLVGDQLINLALKDVDGNTWEYRNDRRGKIMLIDFWSTTCLPCLESLPTLRSINEKFSGQGLEVVSVAYESDGTPQQQGNRIRDLAQRKGLTHRQLLGGGKSCPVMRDFKIVSIPTLILVDGNGTILWRHEGLPDANTVRALENYLQQRLGGRVY